MTTIHASAVPTAAPPPRHIVWTLGLTEIISWGTLYFTFTVFIDPMHQSLGLGKPFLAGGFSLGLLVWALCSFAVGRLLDRVPARKVMGGGSVLAAIGLLLWAWSPSPAMFLLMWIPLGLAMASTLYEPAFVVLRQAYGDGYQKPIVHVTLLAGFASTIFIPLGQWLVLHLGWRGTLVIFAALNLFVCAPLHARLRYTAHATYASAQAGGPLAGAGGPGIARLTLRQPVFWAVVLAFTATAVVASLLGAHLIPMLTEKGMPVGQQLIVAALIGPAQVAGRLAMARLPIHHPVRAVDAGLPRDGRRAALPRARPRLLADAGRRALWLRQRRQHHAARDGHARADLPPPLRHAERADDDAGPDHAGGRAVVRRAAVARRRWLLADAVG